jgi:hypothetical protein
MFRFSFLLAACSLLAQTCFAFTYWVDKSCSDRQYWDEFLDEAINMAKRADARLASPTDSDFGNVFTQIFKTNKNDDRSYPHAKLDDYPNGLLSEDLIPGSAQTASNFVRGKST